MSEAQHTPGDWKRIVQLGDSQGADENPRVYISAPGRGICTMHRLDEYKALPPDDELWANVTLIEAAPSLLAACEAASDLFALGVGAVSTTEFTRANADRCINEGRAVMAQLRAAIAKAKGGAA